MFRRLTRHFAAGLIDNDLIADSQDLHASISGILAALLVVSGAVALMFLGKYNSILQVVNRRVQRAPDQTLADKLAMALDDKALLIGGAMLLMGLVIAFFWDVLALDERDLAVMGPLPVRPSTVLAAKAAAVTGAAVVVAAALNALPAALFPIVLLLKAPVGPGDVMRGMLAHFLAGLAACAFVFLALSSLRGLAGLFGTRSLMRRGLPVAQFALVLGFLSLLFALPVLSGKTRLGIESGAAWVVWSPPLWFLGLEEVLIGRTEAVFGTLARIGVTALALSIAGAGLVHALALRLRTHRLGAGAGSPASMAGRLLSSSIERLARVLSTDGRVRASFVFTARTLTRSPRHRLYLAGSLGVGLAVAGATLASAAAGLGFGREAFTLKYMGLAAQLNLIFFVVIGLRIAATIPADLDAGWLFRFLSTPARERHVAGTRGGIFFVAILPLLIMLAPLHAWLWGGYTALVHFAFGVVAALGLLEIVFNDYARMPFVSAFTPGRAVLSPRIGLYLFDYLLFAYVTPALEQFLIDRTALFYAWVALFLLVVGRFFRSLARGARRDRLPIFDEPPGDLEQFGLWNIVHAPGRNAPVTPGRVPVPEQLFQSIGRDASPVVEAGARSWQSVANQLRLDLVYASRRLRANPGFTAFAVVTLALGIGATTSVYSVIYSTILKPLNVRDVTSLVNVYHATPVHGTRWFWTLSFADFEDLRKTQTVFSSMAARAPFGQVVIAGGAGEKARGEAVSGDYFSMLGIQPVAGRLLQDADDQRGAAPVAVIDEPMWRRRFDSRTDIAGQVIRMAGQDFEIVGVAPAGFHGVESPNVAPTAVWVPLASSAHLLGAAGVPADIHGDREQRWLVAQGRLAPGRTIAEAQAELRVIAGRLDDSHPIGRDLPATLRSPPYVSRRWVALPAADRLVSEQADTGMLRMARLTMIAVTLVLLVACTNLANLTLARGVSRKREIAVRLALGASRAQVVREQLVESAIITVRGGAAAFVAARALTVFGSGTAVRLGAWISVDVTPTLDLATAIAGAAAMALALIVFGLVPALQLTRAHVSLSGGSAGAPDVRWRGRGLLIATQVAVSVALVTLASLCARHVITTASRETGIDLDRLALVRFDFRLQGWTEARATRALERITGEASRQDGIEAVALLSSMPLRASGRSASLTTAERPFTPKYHGQRVTWVAATPSVFKTLGIPLVAGRGFDGRDVPGTARTVVLSESAALKLFGSKDVIGRQVFHRRAPAAGRERVDVLTVLGVARNTDDGAAGRGEDAAYVPFAQSYEPSVTIAARTTRSADAAVMTLKDLTRRLEPEMAVIDSGTGGDVRGVENVAFEIMGAMSGLLGAIAMVLAMAGLYGVLSYVVVQRTHEIGIRIALGAGARQIMRLVLVDGVRPVAEGLVLGLVVADLVEMLTRPALTRPLPAIDASVIALVPIPFLVAACIACYLPTRRATAVDPNVALRHT